MGAGSILNPNLDIEDLIDSDSPFHFIIEIGLQYINKQVQQNTDSSGTLSIRHKKGARKKKEDLNEFQLWSTVVEYISKKEDDMYYLYWKNEKSFPKLREIALSISSFPTSSTDCERMFSMAKSVLGLYRCNISEKRIEMSVLLYGNYELQRKP